MSRKACKPFEIEFNYFGKKSTIVMAKKETNPKRCIAETKKQISRVIDDKTRSDLLEKFNNLGSARSGYSQYNETILNELSVSLAQLTTWAKDFYIGFNGQKTLDECLDLAYELERKSRNKIIKSIQDEERNFSFDLVEKIKKEFFGGKDTLSLKAVSEIFFKGATSKEIQGKRVRGQDAMFDRLLDCTFSESVELFSPEDGIELWRINTDRLSTELFEIYPLDKGISDSLRRNFAKGIKPFEFYHILKAYLFKWERYCTYKPISKKAGL